MNLLEPQKIEEDKKQNATDREVNINNLNIAESIAVKNFNEVKQTIEEDTKKIESDFKKFSESTQHKIDLLTKEVTAIEERKREALMPIKKLKLEAEDKMTEANEKAEENKKLGNELNEERSYITEKMADAIDIKEDANEILAKAKHVEKKSGEATLEREKSIKVLQKKWAKFHEDISKANNEISGREKKNRDDKKANDAVREENERVIEENKQERISIVDTYKAIEQAKIHLGIK